MATRTRGLHFTVPLCAVALCCAGEPILAKNVERLWYSGGAVGFHATQDAIGNNADLEGDPRPDDFVSRETNIQDTIDYSLTAGFGLTKRLSLQLDAAYFRGSVGPLDVYLTDTFPISTDPTHPEILNSAKRREASSPAKVGDLVEIPVTLTGLVRFRTDRAVNPFVGAGFGMVFLEIDPGGEFDALSARLRSLRIRAELDERGSELTPAAFQSLKGQGSVPLTYPVSANVDDSFEWHLSTGVEYFLNDRLSMVAEARYSFVRGTVDLEMSGEDQVDFLIFSEALFRPDGSLRIFNDAGNFPNPLIVPNDPSSGTIKCKVGTVGDFDHDGHADDICYHDDPQSTLDNPVGEVVVQGGRINLSGYAIRLGLRWHF